MASTGRTVSSPLLQVLALWISVLLFPIVCISGHGFLSTPRSRNLVAYEDRKYYQETETTPFPEDCPSCINRGGVLARCGVLRPGQGDARNYDFPKNAFGDPMPANPQQIYEEGSVIDIEVVLTAHHQECFDEHPLTFVSDELYGAPKDLNFPHRAYVAPESIIKKVTSTKPNFEKAMLFKFRMQLPEGLTGDLVLIQWYYVASNSGCVHDGYDTYAFPADWILKLDDNADEVSAWDAKVSVGAGLDNCGNDLPPDGEGTPEQFWNCAEVSIVAKGGVERPSQQLQGEKTIIAYWASWQWYDRNRLADPWVFDYRKYTRVNFAFFQTNEAGDLWGTDSWADPNVLFGPYNWNGVDGVDKEYCSWDKPGLKVCMHHHYEKGLIYLARRAGAEIWPSIGGWSLSDPFSKMAENPVSRRHFANQCIELIEAYDFDGIDIDWEYPGYAAHSGRDVDTEGYNLLLKEVREKLDELGDRTGKFYGLSSALPCGTGHIANIDIATAATYLTELNLMTYDFFGAWSPTVGVNAPLYDQSWGGDDVAGYSIHGCVENWLAGGGLNENINIGLPFYGRGFLHATGLNQTHGGKPDKNLWGLDEGSPQYFNIVNKLPELISIRHEETMTQYAYNPEVRDGVAVGGVVSYDDEQAICDKTEYAVKHNLNGFIIWEVSGDLMDDFSTPLIDAVHAKLADPNLDCRDFAYDEDTFQGTATPLGKEFEKAFAKPPEAEDSGLGSATQEVKQMSCPSVWFWGWVQYDACKSYFKCSNGNIDQSSIGSCPENTRFDEVSNVCKDASQVTCSEEDQSDSTPMSPNTKQEQDHGFGYDPKCDDGLSGFVEGPGCTTYYRCFNGALVTPPTACQEGTLFDKTLSICNFGPSVSCSKAGVTTNAPTKLQAAMQSSPRETTKPTSRPSLRPSANPSKRPTSKPTVIPSVRPSDQPVNQVVNSPTFTSNTSQAGTFVSSYRQPTRRPTRRPIRMPTRMPTTLPVGPNTNNMASEFAMINFLNELDSGAMSKPASPIAVSYSQSRPAPSPIASLYAQPPSVGSPIAALKHESDTPDGSQPSKGSESYSELGNQIGYQIQSAKKMIKRSKKKKGWKKKKMKMKKTKIGRYKKKKQKG